MTSEHVEVRLALSVLARKIKQTSAEMNGQNLANAIYGLHAMDIRHEEVRAVFSSLAHKLVATTKQLSGLDVAMTLFGLRSFSSESPEIRVILGALVYKIKNNADLELQMADLTMAIVGVLQTTPWIRDDFLAVLAEKTPGMTYLKPSDPSSNSTDDNVSSTS